MIKKEMQCREEMILQTEKPQNSWNKFPIYFWSIVNR